jgi:hypothetical protein
MKAGAFIFGLVAVAVAMTPVSLSAQGRTPQIAPLGPTLARPPAGPPSTPPAVMVQPSPQTLCQTRQQLQCDVNNFCQNVPVTVCGNQ